MISFLHKENKRPAAYKRLRCKATEMHVLALQLLTEKKCSYLLIELLQKQKGGLFFLRHNVE